MGRRSTPVATETASKAMPASLALWQARQAFTASPLFLFSGDPRGNRPARYGRAQGLLGAHPQSILLNNQNTAYPTPRPSGNMIHGRHRGVSLNFQAKIPTARRPNSVPMILGSMDDFPLCRTDQGMDYDSGNGGGATLIGENTSLWPNVIGIDNCYRICGQLAMSWRKMQFV